MKSRLAGLVALSLLATGCPKVEDVTQPLYRFYVDHGWIPLPEPDSRFSPGTVFSVLPDRRNLRWEGSLQDCGLPSDLVAPVQAAAGQLQFNLSGDYGASAALQIKGVSAGPDFSKVKTSTLTLDEHGPSSLNMIKIHLWIDDPENKDKIPQTCKDLLNKPNWYVVQEAYSVSKGKYTLKNSSGVKISLKGLDIGPLKIGADAHASTTEDGSLTFDQTLYTAVRELAFANGGFDSLGRSARSADIDHQVLSRLAYIKKRK